MEFLTSKSKHIAIKNEDFTFTPQAKRNYLLSFLSTFSSEPTSCFGLLGHHRAELLCLIRVQIALGSECLFLNCKLLRLPKLHAVFVEPYTKEQKWRASLHLVKWTQVSKQESKPKKTCRLTRNFNFILLGLGPKKPRACIPCNISLCNFLQLPGALIYGCDLPYVNYACNFPRRLISGADESFQTCESQTHKSPVVVLDQKDFSGGRRSGSSPWN